MSAAQRPSLRPVTPVGLAVAALEQGDSARALELLRDLDDYLEDVATPPSPELRALADGSDRHAWSPDESLEAEMLSGHVEGRFLALLVKISGARRLLDIGTFTGYSALAMAEALEDEHVQDGVVVSCELDEGVARMAEAAFATSSAGARIRVEVGPAIDTLERLGSEEAAFDIAFLDADKPGYGDVLDIVLDRSLVRAGGLVLADNTLLQGEPYARSGRSANGEAIAAFNRKVASDPRLEQVVIPLRDGVTIARIAT